MRPQEGQEEGKVFLVCDGCGYFYGNIRLYPEETVHCPECHSEAAWAFSRLDKALQYQNQVYEHKGTTA